MKIQTTQNQMIIDNPIGVVLIVGGILGVGGIVLAIYSLVTHSQTGLWVGGVLAVLGALIVTFARSTHIVLDTSGESSLSSKTCFSKTTSQTFQLADVSVVLLEAREKTETVQQGNTTRDQTSMTSNLFLVTKTAQRIPLGTATRIMNVGGLVGSLITSLPLKEEGEQIARFIGVQMQASDSIGQLNSLL